MARRDERTDRALYGLFTANRGFYDRENGRGASDRAIANKLTRFGQTPNTETGRKVVDRARQREAQRAEREYQNNKTANEAYRQVYYGANRKEYDGSSPEGRAHRMYQAVHTFLSQPIGGSPSNSTNT